MARAECPRAIPREISSRSSRLRQRSGRRRCPRPDPSRSRQVAAHGPPGEAEPPANLAIAQALRSQLPDLLLGGLRHEVAHWHLRTFVVDGQPIA